MKVDRMSRDKVRRRFPFIQNARVQYGEIQNEKKAKKRKEKKVDTISDRLSH